MVRSERVALEIPGLSSAAEASVVTGRLQSLQGVNFAVIDPKTRLAVVDFDPTRAELPHLLGVCRDAGFEATEYRVDLRFPKPVKLKSG